MRKKAIRTPKSEDNDCATFVAVTVALALTVAAVPLADFVQEGNHEAKNGDGHDQLHNATDEEQHSGLCGGGDGFWRK